MRTIKLGERITAANDREADALRERLRAKGILLVDLMGASGSGRTSLLSRIITDMKDLRAGVMEADIASGIDAGRAEALGARTVRVRTGGLCHLDAEMTAEAVDALDTDGLDLIFRENVGNLVCPAGFDTGAGKKLMVLSVPEGDEKPLKYPLAFAESDAVVISKTDAMGCFPFDMEALRDRVRMLAPGAKIFPLSAKTGEGMEALEAWLRDALREWRS